MVPIMSSIPGASGVRLPLLDVIATVSVMSSSYLDINQRLSVLSQGRNRLASVVMSKKKSDRLLRCRLLKKH